jgi:uncharacterized protein YdhG (YjbR/CyaY superfamily)
MKDDSTKPTTIDEYLAAFPPEVQLILEKIRVTIQEAVPDAEETISYGMPTFTYKGGPLVYFGAFKKHIGFYPPIRDEKLREEASIYEGEKGSLRFPLDQPIPYALIGRIAKARARESAEGEGAKRKKPPA